MNNQSIQAFLADRGYGTKPRLYIKNNELHYTKVGCMSRFASKLGFGNASMSNVAKFVRKNQDTCFANNNEIKSYNDFIATYNSKQRCCWKIAKLAKLIPHSDVHLSRDEAHEAIKTHIETCKHLIQDDTQHHLLIQTCEELKNLVEEWSFDGDISKEEKQTLNAILELKNQIRNSLFPPKNSPLKGPETPQIPTHLSDEDKQLLRTSLKEMRTAVLKTYFHDRLKDDTFQLHALKKTLSRAWSFSLSRIPILKRSTRSMAKKIGQRQTDCHT